MVDINIKSQPVVTNDKDYQLPNLSPNIKSSDTGKIETEIKSDEAQLAANKKLQDNLSNQIKQAIQKLTNNIKQQQASNILAQRDHDLSNIITKLGRDQLPTVPDIQKYQNTISTLYTRLPGPWDNIQSTHNNLQSLLSLVKQHNQSIAKANQIQQNISQDTQSLYKTQIEYYTSQLKQQNISVPPDIKNDAASVKKMHNLVAQIKFKQEKQFIKDPDDVVNIIVMSELSRVQQFDNQLKFISSDMQNRNDYMKSINDVLSKARTNRPADDDHPGPLPNSVIAFMKAHGLDTPGINAKIKPEKYDQYVLAVKGLLDDNNNESQLQMVKLQRVVSYRNQCFEFASNTISKLVRSRDVIVGNIRG